MRAVRLPGTVADPQEMPRGAVPIARSGIDAGERLLVGQQQSFVAGVEIRGFQLRMALQIEPAGAHEAERLGDAVGELEITPRLRAVLDRAQHPLMHAAEIGVAALGEGAQQIEGRRALAVGLELPMRIGGTRFRRELDVVDDVAAIARQLLAVPLLGRRGARLGELAGNAADLHDRRSRRIGEHDRHLQKHPEEVANIVGAVLGEAFRAIAALQQESVSGRDPAQRPLEAACLAGEHQRREGRELAFDPGERRRVGVLRKLLGRPAPPAVGGPALGHDHLRHFPCEHPRAFRPGSGRGYTRPTGLASNEARRLASAGLPTRPPPAYSAPRACAS